MRPLAAALAAVLAISVAETGRAAWSASVSGAGSAAARTMPAGAKPALGVSGRSVTVTWPASNFTAGPGVPAYVVTRYNLLGGAQAVLPSCDGLVAGLSCTEANVPPGTWKYSVTPAAGSWRGAEGPQSDPALVL